VLNLHHFKGLPLGLFFHNFEGPHIVYAKGAVLNRHRADRDSEISEIIIRQINFTEAMMACIIYGKNVSAFDNCEILNVIAGTFHPDRPPEIIARRFDFNTVFLRQIAKIQRNTDIAVRIG
jgi:hypothetical protein